MPPTTRSHANGAAKTEKSTSASAFRNEKTDYTRWRMTDDEGKHIWHYLESDEAVKKWPQSKAEKYYLGLDTV